MENTRESFGIQIINSRKMQNITQEQLADKAGITRNNLSRIENGKYNPGLDILNRIADALELQLLLGDDYLE